METFVYEVNHFEQCLLSCLWLSRFLLWLTHCVVINTCLDDVTACMACIWMQYQCATAESLPQCLRSIQTNTRRNWTTINFTVICHIMKGLKSFQNPNNIFARPKNYFFGSKIISLPIIIHFFFRSFECRSTVEFNFLNNFMCHSNRCLRVNMCALEW